MKIRTTFNRLAAAFAIIASFCAACPVSGEEISLQNVPLDDVIVNLARQAGRNFILDAKLSAPFDADGKVIQRPSVTFHEGDTTVEQALGQILKEHGLVMVEDPVTTVARITFTNQPSEKADASFLVGGTNAPVPLLAFSDVPVDAAIQYIAGTGHLGVALDPKISDGYRSSDGKLVTPPLVSIRWKNITARQSLLALCLNYDLNIIKDDKTGVWRIEMKP